MESKRLEHAALAAGISPDYINAHGKPQSITALTKRRLLDAMHPALGRPHFHLVPPVQVFIRGKRRCYRCRAKASSAGI